ncbi:hypothetical protein L6452_35675 [Arctium lappa]|uniref:Uncharacterized protein n=1 Tax=Arctium lappa TaxID=4217 RepID=A0ACB8Y7Y3_ARCLA|nr:hypothetical protein L6452_35675 [Arctium lappa]
MAVVAYDKWGKGDVIGGGCGGPDRKSNLFHTPVSPSMKNINHFHGPNHTFQITKIPKTIMVTHYNPHSPKP